MSRGYDRSYLLYEHHCSVFVVANGVSAAFDGGSDFHLLLGHQYYHSLAVRHLHLLQERFLVGSVWESPQAESLCELRLAGTKGGV